MNATETKATTVFGRLGIGATFRYHQPGDPTPLTYVKILEIRLAGGRRANAVVSSDGMTPSDTESNKRYATFDNHVAVKVIQDVAGTETGKT